MLLVMMLFEIVIISLDIFHFISLNILHGNNKVIFSLMMLDIVSITIALAINLKVKADINLYLEENIKSI